MIVLQIESIKAFMERMFCSDMFDRFHLKSCEVTTFVTFSLDGKRYDEWFDSEEKSRDSMGLVTWKQVKPYVYEWIKGKKAPNKMKIDFCHYMSNGDVGSVRIQYEKETLLLFTGYMQKEFTLDKSVQRSWDENCKEFIKKNEIVSTQLE